MSENFLIVSTDEVTNYVVKRIEQEKTAKLDEVVRKLNGHLTKYDLFSKLWIDASNGRWPVLMHDVFIFVYEYILRTLKQKF